MLVFYGDGFVIQASQEKVQEELRKLYDHGFDVGIIGGNYTSFQTFFNVNPKLKGAKAYESVDEFLKDKLGIEPDPYDGWNPL